MELIVLGSGTFVPELTRHGPSYLVKVGKQNLIFDFGRGILDQLMKLGIKYHDIDAIFISHIHADHCSEIISWLHVFLDLIWTNFPYPPNKERLKNKEIRIYGPKGIKRMIKYLLKAFSLDKNKYVYRINVKELSNKEIVRGKGWTIKCFSVKHSNVKNLAYRLESQNKILTYGGDSIDCLGLRNACKDADLALVEATLPKKSKSRTHGNAKEAATIAKELGIKKLVLMHVAPIYFEKFNPKKEAEKIFKGKVIIAKDLMKIKV